VPTVPVVPSGGSVVVLPGIVSMVKDVMEFLYVVFVLLLLPPLVVDL